MRTFFLAFGPMIKQNFSIESFNIVDIYPLMCKILDITPSPNNGSLTVVSTMLDDKPNKQERDQRLAAFVFNREECRDIKYTSKVVILCKVNFI